MQESFFCFFLQVNLSNARQGLLSSKKKTENEAEAARGSVSETAARQRERGRVECERASEGDERTFVWGNQSKK